MMKLSTLTIRLLVAVVLVASPLGVCCCLAQSHQDEAGSGELAAAIDEHACCATDEPVAPTQPDDSIPGDSCPMRDSSCPSDEGMRCELSPRDEVELAAPGFFSAGDDFVFLPVLAYTVSSLTDTSLFHATTISPPGIRSVTLRALSCLFII